LTRTSTRTATPTIPRPVGPEVLAFGIATADNHVRTPIGQTDDGVPIYDFPVSSGFIIFVEGRPGTSLRPLSACPVGGGCPGGAFRLIADRPLGNGSPAVCDTTPPFIGGVPAVPSLMFDGSQQVMDAIDDLACRFESFNPPSAQSPSGCTLDQNGNFKFVDSRSTLQYCPIQVVGADIAFPSGLTRLKVQLRDSAGNLGNQVQIAISIP